MDEQNRGKSFLYFVGAACWVLFLPTTGYIENFGSAIFWAFIANLLWTTGFIYYDNRTEWGSILLTVVSSILFTAYFAKFGFPMLGSPNRYYSENMLYIGAVGIASGISVASVIGGTIGYFLIAKDHLFSKPDTGPNKNDSTSQFDNMDKEETGDFGYDSNTFYGRGSSASKVAPYGTEKHHPDDSNLWDIVNDSNASEGEQMNALRAIKKREAKR